MKKISSKYFQEIEFMRCIPACSLQNMDQEFMNRLDQLREEAGIPLVLNCAYRSYKWEKSKGRSGKGDHPQGKAADLRCRDSATRYKILRAAFKVRFTRIGVSDTFIHVGMGKDLPEEVVWMY
ncbi:MAG: D-Ala-D-Ala carboxypeptidase family metallohydrolase [Bacteroides sp.]|nr:D-Ala-D-Ala carboxypeptidase family metallohydrolase [Bacteroides sp.]